MFNEKLDRKIDKLIHGFLKRKGALQQTSHCALPAWSAEFYGLQNSLQFQQANDEDQLHILSSCAQDLLNESYHIEKIGMEYCAKLTLIATTSEAQQLFSFMAADEATHLQWITPYIPENRRSQTNSLLLSLIHQVLVLNNVNLLCYLVQIILEGWGLLHYKQLSTYCIDPQLKQVFFNILQDEALHHQSGKTLFVGNQLSLSDKHILKEHLKAYCDLVRIGPQAIVQAVEKSLGGLLPRQRVELFTALKTTDTSQYKLNYLKNLMQQPGLEAVIQSLHDDGYFTPYSAQKCAAIG